MGQPTTDPAGGVRPSRRLRVYRGAAVAVAGLAATTGILLTLRGDISLASVALVYLLPVVGTAAIGGVWLALAAAIAADLLVNFFFVPPYHTLWVESGDNTITLMVYVLVAAAMAAAVDLAARQRATAERRTAEVRLLAKVSGGPVAENSLARLLTHVRDSYHMTTVAFSERDTIVERVGPPPVGPPSLSARAGDGARLLAWGPPVFAEDRGALSRLAAAAARTHETQRLADEAARAKELAEVDRLRAALLNAVGHDLRTPLAGIKAAISSLRQPGIEWDPDDEAELLATVEESADRLDALLENLLSLSRLEAGVLSVALRPVPLDGVVAEALLAMAPTAAKTIVDVPDDLPLVLADPGLLERVVANLVGNARAASPPGGEVRVEGRVAGDVLALRIIDHGPGIPEADRERVFEPFQRRDDHTNEGLGLGLAIARGFAEAMGGTVTPSDAPGGGLTMTVTIPVAP